MSELALGEVAVTDETDPMFLGREFVCRVTIGRNRQGGTKRFLLKLDEARQLHEQLGRWLEVHRGDEC